jgi:hypothetical protein
MGYFLIGATITIVPDALDLLQQPNIYFHTNGAIVVAFAVAMLAWPLFYWRRSA